MFDIRSLTWDEWSYPEGVILPIITLGLSDPRIAELREMSQGFSIKLHSETQVSGRLSMSEGWSPRHAQNPLSVEQNNPPCPITPTVISSSVHHFISSIDYSFFIVLQCHLKDLFVPKSDVKQWFTITTTTLLSVSEQALTEGLCTEGLCSH